MGDRAATHIIIGGKLPRLLYEELASIISDYHLLCEEDAEHFDPADLVPGEPLDLIGFDLNGGHVPPLEAFCQANGLVYWRWSGSCAGAFEAEIEIHDVAGGQPRTYTATDSENPVASMGDLAGFADLRDVQEFIARSSFAVPPFSVIDAPLAARRSPLAARRSPLAARRRGAAGNLTWRAAPSGPTRSRSS